VNLSIESGIRTLCVESERVGSRIGDRMGPHQQTQRTVRPYIVYSRIAAEHERHLLAASGLVFVRLQLDLYADSYDDLVELVEAVRMLLDGYRGVVAHASGATVEFQNVELVDELSDYESPNDGSDVGPQHHRMDFRVSALEPIPTLT
jgi:hypothetical protein